MLGANKNRQKIFSILLVLFMMLSFTGSFPVTVKADSEPPEEAVSLTVTSCEPANDTSNIPVDTTIKLNFSEEIQPGENWDAINLVAGDNPVEITNEIQGQTLLIKPLSVLPFDAACLIKVPLGTIRSLNGELITSEYILTFTTASKPLQEASEEPAEDISKLTQDYASYDSVTPPPGLDLKAVQSPPALQVKRELATTDVLLIQSVVPWSSNANEQVLSQLGLGYAMVDINQAANMDFSEYQLVMIANDQNNAFYNGLASIKSKLGNYVASGGSLLYGACDYGWGGGTHQGMLPGEVGLAEIDPQNYNYVSDSNHPIVTGEASEGIPLTNTDLYSNYASHRNFDISTLPPDSRVILNSGDANKPTLIEYGIGNGTVIASTLTWEHNYVQHTGGDGYGTFARRAFDDLILYAYTSTNNRLTPRELCLIYDPETREFSWVLEPIDTGTGAHMLQKQLLHINGAIPLDFEISYNSLMLNEGVLGKGWGHNFETRLEAQEDENIMLHWSANRRNLFKLADDNSYSCSDPACRLDLLIKNEDGSYFLTRKNNTTYKFDLSGRLIQQSNGHGQVINLSYDDSDYLTAITEPISGLAISLSYNNEKILTAISDNLNRQITFSYDANHNLTGISCPGGVESVFTYDETGQIISESDGEGRLVFQNSYDSQGRVISQLDGKNQISTLDYDENSQPGMIITTITDRNGHTIRYTHNCKYEVVSIMDELGNNTTYTYDSDGNRNSISNALGNTTRMTYDNCRNLTSISDPEGNTTTLTYDQRNNLISLQNAAGKKTVNSYDDNNRLTSITDPMNNTVCFSYDADGMLLSRTSPEGNISSYSYENGMLKSMTDPSGIISNYQHDAAGRLVSITNAAGKTLTVNHDDADNITAITDPLGHSRQFTFDRSGNLIGETDPCGYQTSFTYDANNNLLTTIDAQNNQVTHEYDPEDRLVKTSDSRGNDTSITRDAKGRVISLTDPLGNTITMQYDAIDNLTTISDALGHQISSTVYDNCNNPVSISDALGNTTNNAFDSLNLLVKQTNPLGHATTYTYDDLNRLITTLDALNGQGSREFDSEGNLTASSDPNTNRHSFTYDPAGRLTALSNVIGTLTYSYNECGLLMELTNGRGQTSSYQYDDAGRLQSFTDAEGSVDYTYDANGNLLTTSDSSGTITREYDSLNRPVSYTDARGNTIQYSYNQAGNLTELSYPDGKVVSYDYDAANRLIKVSDWAGRITGYNYDANGRLLETHRPDGSAEIRSYDAAGRTVQIRDCGADGSLIKQYDLSYDAAGNITGEQVSPENPPYMLEDAVMDYNSGNRLESLNGEAIGYDADGNMTSGPLNGKIKEFTFDSRNRLTAAGLAIYSYDAENNRIAVKQNNTETSFVVNPNTSLSQVLVQTEPDGKQTHYVYGLGLIGQEDENGYRSYHYDLRGSTVALSNQSGIITDTFQYGTYGELLDHTGTTATPFLYNGRDGVMTDLNGLYYMRARYYNPDIRRFVNQDILLGDISKPQSLNRYVYVNGQPVNSIDPFGYIPYTMECDDKYYFVPTDKMKDVVQDALGYVPGGSLATWAINKGLGLEKISEEDLKIISNTALDTINLYSHTKKAGRCAKFLGKSAGSVSLVLNTKDLYNDIFYAGNKREIVIERILGQYLVSDTRELTIARYAYALQEFKKLELAGKVHYEFDRWGNLRWYSYQPESFDKLIEELISLSYKERE